MTYNRRVSDALGKLKHQLQCAYSGELGAAYAYRGHWHSARDPKEREQLRQIEADEWHHRDLVGGLLAQLGAKPQPIREAVFWMIGKSIAGFCHVGGWFFPIWGAGLLERHNIVEYEDCAEYAAGCGREEMIECLLTMAEVEWDHERWFHEKARTHWLMRVFPDWDDPPPRDSYRGEFAAFLGRAFVARPGVPLTGFEPVSQP